MTDPTPASSASASTPLDSLTSTSSTPLLERLPQHCHATPDKVAATFLGPGPDGGIIQRQLTYRQLDSVTSRLAQRLTAKEGLRPGDRAVLVYPPSLDFMVAFLACLKARIVAVPVFPPHPSRRDSLAMFGTICAACQATAALTNAEYNHAKKLGALKDAFALSRAKSVPWPDLKWIVVAADSSNEDGKVAATTTESAQSPTSSHHDNDVAFLQFTSGSTSDPKGVMITHNNLAHNLDLITTELRATSDTVVVSWLPQYHDMGLIGSYLGVLYCGGAGYYMSPLTFLQRPMMWMEAVSKYRATHLQAPNFAFKLTARKLVPSDYTGRPLDLSSVRHIINAAEPVDVAALDAFDKAFGPFGLKPGVVFPTYGLAEHTVFVCTNGRSRVTVNKEQLESHGRAVLVAAKDESTVPVTRLVGCGTPPSSVSVKIVNAESSTLCEDGTVGEIWIDSPSKAAGYYLKPNETQHDFHATIATDDEGNLAAHSGGYLRTGDLGFFHEGELYICGRLKDLIIIGGRNYYPQDIEATAEATSDAIRPGCSAAFSVEGTSGEGGEQVVLVMELKDVPSSPSQVETVCSALANQVRSAVTQEHSLGVSDICFLQTRSVPKTSSGKIARAWCRKGYVNGTLNVVYRRSFASSDASPLEIEAEDSGPAKQASAVNGSTMPTSTEVAKLRSMDRVDILAKLKLDVSRLASLPIEAVDKDTALATMLDSLTLSQLKGLLENNYSVKISDEYLFRESATLQKLVDVVKLGYAPDDSDAAASGGGGTSAPTQAAVAAPGRATGLAGALGCPPGVVCAIL